MEFARERRNHLSDELHEMGMLSIGHVGWLFARRQSHGIHNNSLSVLIAVIRGQERPPHNDVTIRGTSNVHGMFTELILVRLLTRHLYDQTSCCGPVSQPWRV